MNTNLLNRQLGSYPGYREDERYEEPVLLDKNTRFRTYMHYTDPEADLRDPITVFGREKPDLFYNYDDRLLGDRWRAGWERALLTATPSTARFFEVALNHFHDSVNVNLQHVLLGVNRSSGYQYMVFGYTYKPKMKFEISKDRSKLTFIVDESARAELREMDEAGVNSIHTDRTMGDWFEGIIANSELSWIPEGTTGDLTDAPIIGILGEEMTKQQIEDAKIEDAKIQHYGLLHTGRGECDMYSPVLERWGFMDYAVRSVLEDLRDKGRAVFVDRA